jgi:predicted nucleic-acid-binding protein
MKKYFIDTNVVLRYLLRDHEEYYQLAEQYFKKAKKKEIKLTLLTEAVFEIDYVLRGVYHLPKSESADIILKLILSPYLEVIDRKIMIQAIKKYQKVNIDLFDIYLFYKAQEKQAEVISFDKDFNQL